ncbi:MAG: DUF1772 domain-containing protein [Paracoccaceae bacterium]|nr:DUF1772 domain-containing protein [Paracoccaceae bacterium]
MDFLDISLIFSILSCSLVTGFIFTYAIVVLPGFSKLDDKEYIRAFQVTDEVIQNNQPLFMLTWIGSILSVLGAILASILSPDLAETWFVVLIGVVYLIGVQGITITIHLPINNHIKDLNLDKLDNQTLMKERLKLETKWNYFNNIRTGAGLFVIMSLLLVLTVR